MSTTTIKSIIVYALLMFTLRYKQQEENDFYVNITKAMKLLNRGFFEKVNKIMKIEVLLLEGTRITQVKLPVK